MEFKASATLPSLWARSLFYLVFIGGGWLVVLPEILLYFETRSLLPNTRSTPYVLIGGILFAGASVLAFYAATFLIHSGHGTPFPLDPTNHLVASGPYSRIRNPQAVAMLIMSIAEPIAVRSTILWLMPFLTLIYLEVLAYPFENRSMSARFGKEYEQYCATIPRWFPRRHYTSL